MRFFRACRASTFNDRPINWQLSRQRVPPLETRQADDVWLNLLLFLIGEHADMRGELVTGAVVSVRKAGDRLALWISEADNLETVVKVEF